jgi:hypothetical protein
VILGSLISLIAGGLLLNRLQSVRALKAGEDD